MFKNINELKKNSNDVVILCTGKSINNITKRQWNWILKQDIWAINNFVYHPWVVPTCNHVEVKSYDFPYQQRYLNEKWNKGWKNVNYIFPTNRADYLSSCIGHLNEAKIYTYDFKARGEHPKISKSKKFDANFNPDDTIYKSYDASMSSVIQILYKMGYEKIILFGIDMNTSEYFWTNMNIDVHDKWNKAREGKSKTEPHNASHLKKYVIDFSERHMKPKGREIVVGYKETALYPELRYYEI